MYKLHEKIRADYWNKEKKEVRIKLLLQICEDWLREQRANYFTATKLEYKNQRGVVFETHVQQPDYSELKKQLDEEQKPLTQVELSLLTGFKKRVFNAMSNGFMLELSDFQKFKKTGRL